MVTVGADGCPGGWICAVRGESDGLQIDVIRSFAEVIGRWPDAVIAVDMPIGLPERGARVCDRAARARLGARRASVFPAPIRCCLPSTSHAEASAARRGIDAKGMNIQTWNIVPKIREVDAVMSPGLQTRIIEAHPELAFAAMNGGQPIRAGKKTPEGRAARRDALAGSLPLAETLLSRRRPSGAAEDDLLDAMATLWTADRYLAGQAECLPPVPDVDVRGLRMEIWF